MLIALGHSIKFNPSMATAEYPNMKVVLLPDTSINLSLLQQGAMNEVHALYKTAVVHNVLQQHAAISVELPNDNVIVLHYVFVRLAVCW